MDAKVESNTFEMQTLGKARNPGCEATSFIVQGHSRADKPCEDFCISDQENGVFIVLDGIPRIVRNGGYPIPSPGRTAAEIVAHAAHEILLRTLDSATDIQKCVRDAAIGANKTLREYNEIHHAVPDYLENDLAGACGVISVVHNGVLFGVYVGDPFGYLVRGKKATSFIKSQTESFPEVIKNLAREGKTTQAEIQLELYKEMRNNPSHLNGFGAFTGEPECLHFLTDVKIQLQKGDQIVLSTDGLGPVVDHAPELLLDASPEELAKKAELLEKEFGMRSDDKTIVRVLIQSGNELEFPPIRELELPVEKHTSPIPTASLPQVTERNAGIIPIRILGPEFAWGGELKISLTDSFSLEDFKNHTLGIARNLNQRFSGYIVNQEGREICYHLSRLPRRDSEIVPVVSEFYGRLQALYESLVQIGVNVQVSVEKLGSGLRAVYGLDEGYFDGRRQEIIAAVAQDNNMSIEEFLSLFAARIGNPTEFGVDLSKCRNASDASNILKNSSFAIRHSPDEVVSLLSLPAKIEPVNIFSASSSIYEEPAVVVTMESNEGAFCEMCTVADTLKQARFSVEWLDRERAYNIEITQFSNHRSAKVS